MADVFSKVPNFRQATGGSSVARLQNFLKSNIGNTQKLQSQVENAIQGQEKAANQSIVSDDPAFYRGKSDDVYLNAATAGVGAAQNLSNLNNQLQSRSSLQNVVQAATKSSNPYRSGLDTYLLAADPNSIKSIQNTGENAFKGQFDRVNALLTRSGLSALDQNVIRNRKQASLADFYSKPIDQDQYEEVYEDDNSGAQDSFSGDLRGSGANAFQKLLGGSTEDRLDAGGQALATVFGGGAGAAVYNAIPENLRYKVFDTATKVGKEVYGDTYVNQAGSPQAAINKPGNAALNYNPMVMGAVAAKNVADKIVGEKVRKQVSNALQVQKAANLAKNAASSVGGAVKGFIKKFCFEASTEFIMADGSSKAIKDIKVGDELMLGGFVYSTISQSVPGEYWWYYKGILVTGAHAVYESGEWTRVKDSIHGVKTDDLAGVVYSLCNNNHRMVSNTNRIVFADFDETDNQTDSLNESLRKLNYGS